MWLYKIIKSYYNTITIKIKIVIVQFYINSPPEALPQYKATSNLKSIWIKN
jgi:hypothetical protein